MSQNKNNKFSFFGSGQPPAQLTQSMELEERQGLGALNISVQIIGILIIAFIGWASFARVNEVTMAPGQIIPSGYVQTVQHLEGGIVREILIEDGELVEQGQALIKLDPTNADADLNQMLSRQNALQLRAMRLRSFADGDSDVSDLPPAEQEILTSMQEARAGQQQVIEDQIMQREKELQGITAGRAALSKNISLMREEYRINKELSKKGSVSKMAVMSSERQLNELEGEMSAAESRENQAQAALEESRNRLQSLNADLRQDAMKNLGEIEAEFAEVNAAIIKLQSASNRTTIEAPIRGIVKGLTVHTIGAVIEPGRTLMELVPVNEDIMVEAMVSPNDIGNLKKDQSVNIKVTAYDFSRYGTVSGKIQTISATTFQNEDGQSFYKAKIKLDQNHIGKDPLANIILPGMVVQANIVTGEKTILEYLLRPIHVATSTAFTEK